MNELQDIASRLREIGENFGGMAKFAQLMGMKTQTLNPYWVGKMKPGNKLQDRLRELGADLEYIMTGKKVFLEESNVKPARGNFFKVIKSINAGDPTYIFSEVNYTGEDIFFPYDKSENCLNLKLFCF